MKQFEIGGVTFSVEEDGLTLRREGEPGVVRMDSQAVAELLDFLRSARVDEFNRRRGFRVPVLSENLRITLHGGFGTLETRARDVSLSGIFLEIERARMPDVHVQDPVQVGITLGDESTVLDGVVRRRTDDGFGIVFSYAADSEDPSPPASYARIVMFLEREWLAARIRT